VPNSRSTTPRERVEGECRRTGTDAVVGKCLAILARGEIDEGFLAVIGGRAAPHVIAGQEGGLTGHWPRIWAMRALLYAWEDHAADAVLAATTDESWRVREMAAEVIAARELDEGLEVLGPLSVDPITRVRAAAERARRRLTATAS